MRTTVIKRVAVTNKQVRETDTTIFFEFPSKMISNIIYLVHLSCFLNKDASPWELFYETRQKGGW